MKKKVLLILLIVLIVSSAGYSFDYYKRYSLGITSSLNYPEYGEKQVAYGILCKYGISDRIQARFIFDSFEGEYSTRYSGSSTIKATGTVIGIGGGYCVAEIIYSRISVVTQLCAKITDMQKLTINRDNFDIDEKITGEMGVGLNYEYRSTYHTTFNFDVLLVSGQDMNITIKSSEFTKDIKFKNRDVRIKAGLCYFF